MFTTVMFAKPIFHLKMLRVELVGISVADTSGLLSSAVQGVLEMRRGLFMLQDKPPTSDVILSLHKARHITWGELAWPKFQNRRLVR